jgi:RNA polymerase sigma-70 factor (ECF subfamily)
VVRAEPSSASAKRGLRDRREDAVVEGLRAGDERVFAELVRDWSGVMLRLALVHVPSRAVAEEVVQEAWLTVLSDLERFQGRSSLRTWVLGIVANLARSRARAERRASARLVGDGPSVDRARFHPLDARRWPGHWAVEPAAWPVPEDALLAGEALRVVVDAVAALPPAQREVLVLRDAAGLGAAETCAALELTDANQRVLLHRARSRVRAALERYLNAEEPT